MIFEAHLSRKLIDICGKNGAMIPLIVQKLIATLTNCGTVQVYLHRMERGRIATECDVNDLHFQDT